MTEAGSADCRSQTVICPGGAAAGPGNSRRRENKVGVRVHITAIDVDDIRFLHNHLAVKKRQLHAIVPWFHFEREPTGVIRRAPLPLSRLQVDHFHAAPINRRRPFRSTYDATDGAVRFSRLRAEIDNRTTVAGGYPEHGDGEHHETDGSDTAMEMNYPHSDLGPPECKREAIAPV